MGEVGDGGTGHGDPRQPADLDALVVLDLADGRADDVHELDGLAPLPGRGGAGEDDEALGVAAHPGGEVVEAEEVRQFVGVLGAAFHRVEESELLVQQDLAAAGEVHEDVGDTVPQFGLFDGGFDGGALKGVQGESDLAYLVLAELQPGCFRLDVDLFAGREAPHDAGQPHAGRLMGVQAQGAQVADETAAHPYGEEDGEQQGDEAEDAGDDRAGDDPDGDGVDAVLVAVVGGGVAGGQLVEDGIGGAVPARRGEHARRARGRGGDGLLGDPQRGGVGAAPEALVADAFRLGQQGQVHLVEEGPLRHEVGDVTDLVPGQASGGEGRAEQGVLTGEQFTGAGETDEARPCLSISGSSRPWTVISRA